MVKSFPKGKEGTSLFTLTAPYCCTNETDLNTIMYSYISDSYTHCINILSKVMYLGFSFREYA